MNKTFAEYTTNTAFALTLTKNQCHILLRVRRGAPGDDYMFHPHQARQLRSRGLIKATTDRERAAMQKAKKPVRIYRLTKAGELLCALLDEAGITLDNTVTLTIARQMAYWKGSDLTAHSTVEGKSEAHL